MLCSKPTTGHGSAWSRDWFPILIWARGWWPGIALPGASQRPGFAWFFGRDSLWTSFALNADGRLRDDSHCARVHQQVSARRRQSSARDCAGSEFCFLVQGFSLSLRLRRRDAALHHCDERLCDAERRFAFAREKWDNVWRAYQFLRSTYDAQGFAQNAGSRTWLGRGRSAAAGEE